MTPSALEITAIVGILCVIVALVAALGWVLQS